MPRLRARFGRGEEVKFISHLDLVRFWQRAFRRAGLPLGYSQGFNPHPRLSLAAPLAVGVTSEAELMEFYLERALPPSLVLGALERKLPRGFEVYQVYVVPDSIPSLQSQVRFAEYRVQVTYPGRREDIGQKMASLLALESLAWQHERDTGIKKYDLRALISDIWLLYCDGGRVVLGMRLECSSRGAGRPEQVVLALGLPAPEFIHRTKLILEPSSTLG